VRAAVVVLAVVIITVDLGLAGAQARAARSPRDPLDGIATLASVDLGSYYQPGGAASFLQAQLAASPFRFLGYAPDVDGRMLAYTVRSFDASTAALLVNNRAVALGLQDVQGYDASHLRRYDDYLAVLNGQTQNYHDAEVFPHGLTSPLLDLLNTRYVIVPRARTEASPVLHRYLQVYADEQVTILENLSALPRAWIVHTATQADPDAASPAELLTTGDVDGRLMAILEQPPPALEFPANPSLDRADLTDYQADSLSLRTYSEASGLVVLSEIYYPSWTAYVDGNPTRLYVADGVLRAVPVPAGEHRVELRFESATLEYGVFISLIASIVLMLLALAALSTRTCRPPLGNAAQPTFAAIARVAVHYRQRIVRSASGSSRELSGLAPRRTP
jgi:hypothetical protein